MSRPWVAVLGPATQADAVLGPLGKDQAVGHLAGPAQGDRPRYPVEPLLAYQQQGECGCREGLGPRGSAAGGGGSSSEEDLEAGRDALVQVGVRVHQHLWQAQGLRLWSRVNDEEKDENRG